MSDTFSLTVNWRHIKGIKTSWNGQMVGLLSKMRGEATFYINIDTCRFLRKIFGLLKITEQISVELLEDKHVLITGNFLKSLLHDLVELGIYQTVKQGSTDYKNNNEV
jgi:hypothetical protein